MEKNLERFNIRNWRNLLSISNYNLPSKYALESGYDKPKALTFMTEPSLSHFSKNRPTSKIMEIHLHLPFFKMDSI